MLFFNNSFKREGIEKTLFQIKQKQLFLDFWLECDFHPDPSNSYAVCGISGSSSITDNVDMHSCFNSFYCPYTHKYCSSSEATVCWKHLVDFCILNIHDIFQLTSHWNSYETCISCSEVYRFLIDPEEYSISSSFCLDQFELRGWHQNSSTFLITRFLTWT